MASLPATKGLGSPTKRLIKGNPRSGSRIVPETGAAAAGSSQCRARAQRGVKAPSGRHGTLTSALGIPPVTPALGAPALE